MLHGRLLCCIIGIAVISVGAGGADVLYNKFNVTWWWLSLPSPPVNPPYSTSSEYKCVVDTGGDYWRLALCTELHHVVCQG